MDQSRGHNHPPQLKQLMRIWGKKKRTENKRKNKRKKQGSNPPPTQLPGPFGLLLQPAWMTILLEPTLQQKLKINVRKSIVMRL